MNYSDFQKAMESISAEQLHRLVMSSPTAGEYRKICVERIGGGFQAACYTATQVFHKNLRSEEVIPYCVETVTGCFKQVNLWKKDGSTAQAMLSKKGAVRWMETASRQPVAERESHNREKHYILREGMNVPPLVDMGVFAADGHVVQSKYDKFKQINRFLELLEDACKTLPTDRTIKIVDFGCGKAYLTFVVYYYLVELCHLSVEMVGLDLKQDVIEKCNAAAKKYGYDGLRFQLGNIKDYSGEGEIDMVLTLHACDTATDYALHYAVQRKARMIFSVPCCQHELNGQMQSEDLSLLTRYGIVKERFSALTTDAIRANLLAYCGYQAQLLEFVEIENTPKNILIRAVKKPLSTEKQRKKYLDEVERVMTAFRLRPTLYRLLLENGEENEISC